MSLSSAGILPFELAGLLTHLVVFAIGVSGSLGLVPLPRGRRSGLGLTLMALAMAILVLQPGAPWSTLAAASYTVAFALALWLLIGPSWPVGALRKRWANRRF